MRRRSRLYQSQEQAIVVGSLGVALGIAAPALAFSPPEVGEPGLQLVAAWAVTTIGFLSGLWLILRAARCGVRVSEEGLKVVNPFRTDFIPWHQVAGFSIGPWGPYPGIGWVELVDGRRLHVWGIEIPNPLIRPHNAGAQRVIDQLEQERQAHLRRVSESSRSD